MSGASGPSLPGWRGRWPGLVWAFPLAALIIVAYLGAQSLGKVGIDVVVTFDSAHGARQGETPVFYEGVRIGRVAKIQVSRDIRHVDMTLRLEPRAREGLREGAKFWMIGAEPSLTDLSSLTALLSGVSIGMAPGTGAPQRHFTGLDAPPPVPPDEQGSYFLLSGSDLGSTRVGAGVYHQGLEVGRVTRLTLEPMVGFQLTAFVQAPYDRLVKPDSQFFRTQAVQIRFSQNALAASLGPGSSALTGGVEFDTPPEALGERPSLSGASFRFYDDRAEAELGPLGPQVSYRALVADAGGLKSGSPVLLEGFPVGRVLRRSLSLDAEQGQAAAVVQLVIDPERLGLTDRAVAGAAQSPDDWRQRTNEALTRLLRRGYRLQLIQSPPVVGPQALQLVRMETPPPVHVRISEGWLPAAAAPSLASLITHADSVMRTVNTLPIAEIGRNLRQLSARLNNLVASPQLAESLTHLRAALANLDQITADVRPQAGPLARKLVEAADQLDQVGATANQLLGGQGATPDANLTDTLRQITDAARSLRSLADDLDRHPEALLKGKRAP